MKKSVVIALTAVGVFTICLVGSIVIKNIKHVDDTYLYYYNNADNEVCCAEFQSKETMEVFDEFIKSIEKQKAES